MRDTAILVTRGGFGTTLPEDTPFGLEMLEKFLHTLEKLPEKPAVICFYTEGVRLVVTGSPVLLALKLLAESGVRLLVCQSCLQQYALTDRVAVGEVGGMPDIVAAMAQAGKVITI